MDPHGSDLRVRGARRHPSTLDLKLQAYRFDLAAKTLVKLAGIRRGPLRELMAGHQPGEPTQRDGHPLGLVTGPEDQRPGLEERPKLRAGQLRGRFRLIEGHQGRFELTGGEERNRPGDGAQLGMRGDRGAAHQQREASRQAAHGW